MLAYKGKSFRVMNYRYDVDMVDATVSDVTLGDIEYNGGYSNVNLSFVVKEKDVEFTIEALVVLYFDTDAKEWNLSYFDSEKLVDFKCAAIGKWTGTNDTAKVELTINDTLLEGNTYLSASVTVTSAEGVTGTYEAYIYEYKPETLYMSIEDGDWTVKPTDTSIRKTSFYGYLDENMSTFKGKYSSDKWSFTKQP